MEANNQKECFEVLKNLAEEQQKICRMLTQNDTKTELIANKMDAFMEQIKKIKTEMPQVNLQSIEELIRRDIAARQKREGEQPLKVIRQLQILLFPPQDARLFYKIVFGRWLIWLMVMLVITDLYKWGVHYTDVHQRVNPPQLQQLRKPKPEEKKSNKQNKVRERNLFLDSGMNGKQEF
jgi:uncharacterized membrane protein